MPIAGATVFADTDGNGTLDPGEVSTTSDAFGIFTLVDETGQLVAYGGTDISTELQFNGTLSAPAGSSQITPLTSLIVALQNLGASNLDTTVHSAFGIDPSFDLTNTDPIAAAQAGDPAGARAYAVGVEVMDTVAMIASALTSTGPVASNTVQVFAALANLVSTQQAAMNLTDVNLLNQLVSASAEALHQTFDVTFASALAEIVAASNSALEHSTDGLTGQTLVDAASIVERLAQGAASDALEQAAANSNLINVVENAFTGSNLADALTPPVSGGNHAPWLASDSVASHGIAEFAQTTGSSGIDTVSGTLLFTDADVADTHQVNVALDQSSLTWTKADGNSALGRAPPDLLSALSGAVQTSLVSDSTNGAVGEIGWSFGLPDRNFDFLAAGETLSISYDITVTDSNGLSSSQPVTIVVIGTNDTPTIDMAHSTLAGAISELPNVTGRSVIDSTSGVIAFSEPDLNDRPTTAIDTGHQTVAWQDNSHVFALSASQIAMFAQAFQLNPEVGNTNAGKIDWSFGIIDKLIDFLGIGERVTVTTPVVVDDHQGGVIAQDVVVTVNGVNDNPIATPDSNGITKGLKLSVATSAGVLANDTDPDVHDQGHLVVSAVNGAAVGVGHGVQGTYGSLTLNADGSYVYTANQGALPSQIAAQDIFSYTVSDGHGGTAFSNLDVVVLDPSASYQAGTDTTLNGGNGKNVLDGSAGNDVLMGGNGADVLIGGNDNTLTGGLGPDTFLFRPNFGVNTITDFDINNDVIQFDKSIFQLVSAVASHTSDSSAGAVINDGHGDRLTLTGVTAAQLAAHTSDFHLV